jgi:Mce-associated membrane protein
VTEKDDTTATADADETAVDADETVTDAEATDTQAPDATDTEATDADAPTPPPPVRPAKASGGVNPARLILPIALALILVLSAGAAVFTYVALYRSDQKVDQAAAAEVIQSASDGAVALLSYTPDTLDQDFAKAKSLLTGDFLNYYTQFTQEIVTPAAKQKSVKTSAAVVRSALSRLEPTSAEVLLFINQSTVSKENPDGSFTASSVKVEMTKVGDDWLISSFDPV